MSERIKVKYMEKFIERFSFNSDADLQYFKDGLIADKPYIEQLRLKVVLLSKSQNQFKKIYLNRKVQTTKNKTKSKEVISTLNINYLNVVESLKDNHQFVTSLFKLKYLIDKYKTPESVLKNYSSMPTNFSEVIQNIKFQKEEWIALNNFNRMRNIVIHAPSEIVVEYLTSTVLDEFIINIIEMATIIYKTLSEYGEDILAVLKLRGDRHEKDEMMCVESLGEIAARYELTVNEVLDIVKNTEHDFVSGICYDMTLDRFDKEAIIDEVRKKSKEKAKAKQLEIITLKEKEFKSEDKVLIIDLDHATELHNHNYDLIVNNIYDLSSFVNPVKTLILISDDKGIQKNIAKEVSFLIKNKEHNILHKEDVVSHTVSLGSTKLAVYCNEDLYPTLNEINNEKYLLMHKNKNRKISYPLKDASKLVFHNKSIVELSSIENMLSH